MLVEAGSVSADGHWYWDGREWLRALSPDGCWRWDGREWTPVATTRPSVLGPLWAWFWNPPWTRREIVAALWVLAGAPIMLAAGTSLASIVFNLDAETIVWCGVAELLVWALLAGLSVRGSRRWREILIVAGLLTGIVCWVYVCATLFGPDPDNQADHVAGIGAIVIALIAYPPFLVCVATGRGVRRGLQLAHRAFKRS